MGQNEGAGRLALATAQEKRGEKRTEEQQHRFSGAALAASLTVCSVKSLKILDEFCRDAGKNK